MCPCVHGRRECSIVLYYVKYNFLYFSCVAAVARPPRPRGETSCRGGQWEAAFQRKRDLPVGAGRARPAVASYRRPFNYEIRFNKQPPQSPKLFWTQEGASFRLRRVVNEDDKEEVECSADAPCVMMTPQRPMADRRVFDWLGLDVKGVPYYLHPLNLVWSDEGVEQDLRVYRRVADLLAADPAYWAEIIREASWRHCLAGCACLLASRKHAFHEELCHRFRAGSFVAPQIAVTLGLLHAAAARLFFESALDDPVLRRSPKQAISAHRVLLRLGVQPHHNIAVDSWSEFERSDAMVADKVVSDHWSFWSGRL